MATITVTAYLMLVAFVATATARPANGHSWHLGKWSPGIHNVQNAIYFAFCGGYRYCARGYEAWRVSRCETGGTFSVWAKNGQYLGLFQMGKHERAIFGFGRDPWHQALAAKRYYDYSVRVNGYGWHPWECRP